MEKELIKSLIIKFREKKLSRDEAQLLKSWLDLDDSREIFHQINMELLERDVQKDENIESKKIFDAIAQINAKQKTKSARRIYYYLTGAVAATAAFFFFFGALQKPKLPDSSAKNETLSGSTIVPGGSKAKLVLDNGEIIDLSQLPLDTTLLLPGYKINKNALGELTYSITESQNTSSSRYNTIVTPKGGEYNLQLADGSKIFVNASTKIKYPLKFDKDKREIELEGEAYFEVKKMPQNGRNIPFIVKTREQTLSVLGTSFNINSYGEKIETTLVEGKVKLDYPSLASYQLSPNQQARYDAKTDRLDISEIDPFYITAWKNGNFAFDDAPLETVMNDLERWYDVKAEYRGNFSKVRFSGMISKYETIDKVLKAIEMTGSVKFKLNERRIIVMR